MNNKETLQSYNTELGENNSDLETILTTINDLPDGGSSEDLSDELDTYDSELNRQETSIANIVDLLATKGVGSGVGGDDMIKYSTEEQVIGEWIDGKPIYRKVFDISSITTSNTDLVNIADLKIENLVNMWGTMKNSAGHIYPMPLTDSTSNYSVIFIRASEAIRGRASDGSGSTITKVTIVLEYTKTTD